MHESAAVGAGAIPDRRWVVLALTCVGAFMAPLEWQQLLLRHGSLHASEAFAWGYPAAMLAGALLALLGAWASLTRGHPEGDARKVGA